jgi:hypothetical protein
VIARAAGRRRCNLVFTSTRASALNAREILPRLPAFALRSDRRGQFKKSALTLSSCRYGFVKPRRAHRVSTPAPRRIDRTRARARARRALVARSSLERAARRRDARETSPIVD